MEKIITKRPNGTKRVSFKPDPEKEPSMCQPQFQDECNINKIMAKYHNNMNAIPDFNPGVFGDFSNAQDYQSCLHTLMEADRQFMSLPSAVRKEFDNDPQRLVEFLSKPENAQKAFDLGLTKTNPSLSQDIQEPKNAKIKNAKKPAPTTDDSNDES